MIANLLSVAEHIGYVRGRLAQRNSYLSTAAMDTLANQLYEAGKELCDLFRGETMP